MEFRTLEFTGHGLRLLDQTRLPQTVQYVDCHTPSDVYQAIRTLVVRGAPAIGVAAGYAMALAVKGKAFSSTNDVAKALENTAAYLKSARPTAVNLAWAVGRMLAVVRQHVADHPEQVICLLEAEAARIEDEDRQMCRKIGEHGEPLVPNGAAILTHCNAGALAAAGIGTALAVIYVAHERGKKIKVYADETRPLRQGARLTTWELQQQGIDVTLICDTVPGALFCAEKIDLVIVGADRIVRNGDVANKIGTYQLAVLAEKHRVPFYVAAPESTIDRSLFSGNEIPIEERSPEEVLSTGGLAIAPHGISVYNPAFDVTPNELITAIITDAGIWQGGRWGR